MRRFLDELSVTPLADGEQWRLNSRFRFWSQTLGKTVEVPARFITDFGSVPGLLKLKFPPWSRAGAGYVVHDWSYWLQECTRTEADLVLREALDVLAVEQAAVVEIYEGVHLFGHAAWKRNAELKASGYTRMASTEANPPYAAAA